MVLGEVEETIYAVDEDDEDEEVKVSCPADAWSARINADTGQQNISKKSEMLFVRGENTFGHRFCLVTDDYHRRQRCFDLATSCAMI